ncbi:MAG TPA: M23 family metallopeptidase [Balneolaceae bacterium]
MRKFVLPVFLLFLILPTTLFSQARQSFNPKDAHYLWPNEASHYLTSTFAETRSDHFHAALDLKTWGQRGYEVYATRDGIVHRIAIGPTGYGKVVYLKHPDGSYSVYAHLMAFSNELQQLADSIRFADDYKFGLDRLLGNRNIKVEQGEVIGISGASGIGPPHLHFELRTPNHRPFNPLLTNLDVKDTIAPTIQAISVEPLAARSTIEGKNAIFMRSAWDNGEYFELGNIEVSGPVGLGVKVFDQSNNVHNVYAVYELSLSVDGQKFFTSRADSFSYQNTSQLFIDRVYPLLKKYGSAYQRLFVADGNTLSFYETAANKGILNLEPGTHKVVIRATDYYGNSSKAVFRLTVEENEVNHPSLAGFSGEATDDFAPPFEWNWYNNWLNISKDNFRQLTVGLSDKRRFLNYDNRLAIKLKDNLFMNIPKIGPVKFRRMAPGSVGIVASADQQAFAVFPKHTFHDTVSVGMSVQKFKADSIRVRVISGIFPIQKFYKIYVKRDAKLTKTDNLSFYQLDREDSEWELVPTHFEADYIVIETASLGSFTTLRDSTAPRLSYARLSHRPDGQWLVRVNVTDNLSGIDYTRTKMWVNGVRGIAEYQPEDNRFVYYHPEFSPSPEMKVKVVAFDMMGNRKEKVFYLNHQQGYTN